MRKSLFGLLFLASLSGLLFLAGLLPIAPGVRAQVTILADPDGGELTVAFSPDSTRAFTIGKSAARIWDIASGKQIAVLRAAEAMSFNRDGTRVIARSANELRVLDVATGKDVSVLAHENRVLWAGFSPDGTRILTASGDALSFKYTVSIWDASTGGRIILLVERTDRDLPRFGFSPDGKLIFELASHVVDEPVVIWDAVTGRQITSLKRVYGLEDPATHTITLVEQGHRYGVSTAAFSPDGARVVTTSSVDETRIWDISPGISRVTSVLPSHPGTVRASFSPDGRFIVLTTNATTAAYVYAYGAEAKVLENGHVGGINTAAFSPNSFRIVTASDDKRAIIWDSLTGKEIQILSGHTDIVESAIFSPNGKLVASTSRDGTVRIWTVTD